MKLDLKAVGSLLISFFSAAQVKQVAYQSGLVKRSKAKLSGPIFLQAFVFAGLEHESLSLAKVAQACADLGVNISPQGLDQRISRQSVVFMESMFKAAMSLFVNWIPLPLPVLEQFSAINIVDSSAIPLPKEMAESYPAQGRNPKAATLKIRLVFEFLYGNLMQLLLVPGKAADQGFAGYLQVITAGSLTLADLGHFNLTNFKSISQQQAYYLSRYKHRTRVLTLAGELFDLLDFLSNQLVDVVDEPIRLGKTKPHRLPCRLIAFRLTQELADQRRRRAKQAARRRGQTVSSTSLALLDWSIYVTNVPVEMLNPLQVACLYRVRWQIELVFKLWKSYAGLRNFTHLRAERVLTELYARLIGLVLTHFLVAPIRMPEGTMTNREISPVKVRQIFQRFARTITLCLKDLDQVRLVLHQMFEQISRFGFKQKRRKKPNICHALALVSAVHRLALPAVFQFDLLSCTQSSLT